MAKRFLTSLRLANLSSDPVSASAGDIYYNSSIQAIKLYDGSSWSEVGGIGGGSIIVQSASAYPGSPSNGQLFYNTTTGTTAIYFNSEWKNFLYSYDVQTNLIDGGVSYTNAFISNVDGGSSSD